MQKIIFLTCFLLEITREANFYPPPPPPNHLTSIKKPSQNRVKKETLAQVFSCEFCEISKNTFFYRTPPVVASVYTGHKRLKF